MKRPLSLPARLLPILSLRSVVVSVALATSWNASPAHAQGGVLSSTAAAVNQQTRFTENYLIGYKNTLASNLRGNFNITQVGKAIPGYDLLAAIVSVDGVLYGPFGDLQDGGVVTGRNGRPIGTAFETPGVILVGGAPYVTQNMLNDLLWINYGLKVIGTYMTVKSMPVAPGDERIVGLPLTPRASYTASALKEQYVRDVTAPTREAWLERLHAAVLVDGVPMLPDTSLADIFKNDAALSVTDAGVTQGGQLLAPFYGSNRATAAVKSDGVVYLPVTVVPGVTVDTARGLLNIPHDEKLRVTLQISALGLPELKFADLKNQDALERQQEQARQQQETQARAKAQAQQDAADAEAAAKALAQANVLARQKAQQLAQQAKDAAAAKLQAEETARQQAIKKAAQAALDAAQAKKAAAAQRVQNAAQAKVDAQLQAAAQKNLADAQRAVPGLDLFQIGSSTYAGYRFADHKVFVRIIRMNNGRIADSCSTQTLDSVIVVRANVARAMEDTVIIAVAMLDGTSGYLGFTLRTNNAICVGSVLR